MARSINGREFLVTLFLAALITAALLIMFHSLRSNPQEQERRKERTRVIRKAGEQ